MDRDDAKLNADGEGEDELARAVRHIDLGSDQSLNSDILTARAIAADIELARGSWSTRDSYRAFFNNHVRRDYLRGVYDKGPLVSAVLAGIRHRKAAWDRAGEDLCTI